jgi:membrane-bound serine protease (ClpP class)
MTRISLKNGQFDWRCGPSAVGVLLMLLAMLVAVATPAVCGAALDKDKDSPKTVKRFGRVVHISLPITGHTFERTRRLVRIALERAKKSDVRLVLIFEFDVPAGQKDFGRGSEFGAARDLADFLSSDELNAADTVAYLPKPIQGHAVLAVLACQEIIMADDASLGAAGIDEKTLSETLRSAYAEIAGRRRTVPVAVALGMLDSAIEVLRVETDAVNTTFVTPEELQDLKKKHATSEPTVVKRAGEQSEFSGSEARRWGFARYLAADRREVVKALDLPATAVEDDPSLEGSWRAVRVDLKGPIRADSVSQVQRMIDQHVRNDDANFICLWIDSPGGSMADAMQLANYLAFNVDPAKVRTVAYVPVEARSDAAIVALACDQLVMYPRAVLGGSGAIEPSADEIRLARDIIQNKLAPRKGRSWSLMAAMIDPNLDVFRAARLGDVEYFCEAELAEQAGPGKWEKGPLVTIPGVPLRLSGAQAEEFRLANRVVESFGQFKQYYGLENDPMLAEPGWADNLIRALASPGVAVLLLIIGGAALYMEMHSPGIGIGAFVAAVCFLLFFWSRYLDAAPFWLSVILFVAGVFFIALEIFVIPGFGIFGLGGGAMVLASLILASQQTFIFPRNEYQFNQLERSLLTVAAASIGLIAMAIFVRKRLPHSPLLGRMMLEPPAGEEAQTIRRREALVNLDKLTGQRGTTTTQLTPGGKARIGEMLVDVIADGEVIERGRKIEVVQVQGSHVLVKEVDGG